MDVGNSVRKAIDDHMKGELDAAMLHACNAVDGTAAKVHPSLGSNARFTRLLRENYFILEPMAAPGRDADNTRFPVKVDRPKAPGGLPDFADGLLRRPPMPPRSRGSTARGLRASAQRGRSAWLHAHRGKEGRAWDGASAPQRPDHLRPPRRSRVLTRQRRPACPRRLPLHLRAAPPPARNKSMVGPRGRLPGRRSHRANAPGHPRLRRLDE